MATTTIIDYRSGVAASKRSAHPYWITSEEYAAADSDDLAAVMFSFPATVYDCTALVIQNAACEITTNHAGGTITVDVGACTLATNGVTTDGDSTDVDKDEYVPTADITNGTAAVYYAATGDLITQVELGVIAAPMIITPANTTVPAVAVYVASDDTITAGAGKVHLLITEIP
jgi:hypothetical protein